jgi:hypothetical protein
LRSSAAARRGPLRLCSPLRESPFSLSRRVMLVGTITLFAHSTARAQTACPDSGMLTRSIALEITTAYANWRTSPQVAPPEPCWFIAVARAPYAHTDSVVIKTLALSDEALKRLPGNAEILYARVVLLSRAGRFREVVPAMDSLFVARPAATVEETHRLVVAAAMQMRDTATIINRLANAASRFPRSKTLAPEYEVWRQLPRLRALIDTVHRIMKKDPTLTVGLVNLSSIYGNLDQPDSAIAYARRALRAGVGREAVGRALESLIGVRMRRAKILDTPERWTSTLPVAIAIDSALSTPASKYLVALTLAEIVKAETRVAQFISYGLESGEANGFGRETPTGTGTTYLRVMTCERLGELEQMIVRSKAKLAAGGEAFAPETVPALRGGLNAMTAALAQLKTRCTT